MADAHIPIKIFDLEETKTLLNALEKHYDDLPKEVQKAVDELAGEQD